MKIEKICIVGGGSAGWIAAASIQKHHPDLDVTLIESEDIPTIGVGESTTQFFRDWTHDLCLSDVWMDECEATYKYSVKFENFSEYGSFHYPFFDGGPPSNAKNGILDWFLHYRATDGNPTVSFAEWMVPYWKLIEDNKVGLFDFPGFSNVNNVGYHLDAVKFANYLKREFCIPRGLTHITDTIESIENDEKGNIKSLNGKYEADLFIDCTGFKSLLLKENQGVEWDEFPFLINDRAWAVRLCYNDKKTEQLNHTKCTALNNGWVWHVPLSNRIGTGYNFSSKFISDEDALDEFKAHLGDNERLSDYRLITWDNGVAKEVWKNNVVGIGLSAGFIEPLESNGLLSAHNFSMYLVDALSLHKGKVNTVVRDQFNRRCRRSFQDFAYFVGNHFMLSTRDDTPYWRYLTEEIDYYGAQARDEFAPYPTNQVLLNANNIQAFNFGNLEGNAYICAGMAHSPITWWSCGYMERRDQLDLSLYRELDSGYQLDDDIKRQIDQFPTPEEFYYADVSGIDMPHYIHG